MELLAEEINLRKEMTQKNPKTSFLTQLLNREEDIKLTELNIHLSFGKLKKPQEVNNYSFANELFSNKKFHLLEVIFQLVPNADEAWQRKTILQYFKEGITGSKEDAKRGEYFLEALRKLVSLNETMLIELVELGAFEDINISYFEKDLKACGLVLKYFVGLTLDKKVNETNKKTIYEFVKTTFLKDEISGPPELKEIIEKARNIIGITTKRRKS